MPSEYPELPQRGRRALYLGVVYALTLAAFLAAHEGFGRLAALAEREEGAYLYAEEEWMHPLSPDVHLATDRPMISVFGPSEIREGLVVDQLGARFPDFRVHQDAMSHGTLAELLIFLDLLEEAGGVAARPEVLLVALTPRFVLSHQDKDRTPFLDAIDRYSTRFSVDRLGEAPVLVRKGAWDSLLARFHWWHGQTRRYRHALRALWPRVRDAFGLKPSTAGHGGPRLVPQKFHGWRPTDKSAYFKEGFVEQHETLRVLAAWDPATEGRLSSESLQQLVLRTSDRGIRLIVFIHPMASWARRPWTASQHASFEVMCRKALGATPFVDLSDLLDDSEYFDFFHPSQSGAQRLTVRLGEFLAVHLR